MKRILVSALCATMLLGLVSCSLVGPSSTATPIPDTGPIRIGALYNLVGSQALLDLPSAHGAQLAVEEINQTGGILGRTLELILYDGRTDPQSVAVAASRLLQQQPVAVIGFSDTDQVRIAGRILASAEIPFITSGASSPRLPQELPHCYLACFGDNAQAAAAAEYAVNRNGSKRACILEDRSMEYALLLGDYFRQAFSALGGEIVREEMFAGGEADFSRQILAIGQLDPPPDLIYVACGPEDAGTAVRQLRESGLAQPVMGGDSFDSPTFLRTVKDLQNVAFTTHCLLAEQGGNPRMKQFIAAYRQKWGVTPENAFAALGYDALRLVANAIQQAGTTEGRELEKALEETQDYIAVTGAISYGPGIHVPQKPVAVLLLEEGAFRLAEEILPINVPKP
jgi:branched-chain amino acid transport system substrate-binding protein